MFQGKIPGGIDPWLKMGSVNKFVVIDLSVHITGLLNFPALLQIGVLEFIKALAGTGCEKHSEEKRTYTHYSWAYHIRPKKSPEGNPATQEGDDLGILCQFRSEPDNGEEKKNGKKQIGEIDGEIDIIIYHLYERHLILQDLPDLFGKVYGYPNRYKKKKKEQKSSQVSL